MEFVQDNEVEGLLRSHQITIAPAEEDRVYLLMTDSAGVIHMHLASDECKAKPREGAQVIDIPRDRLAHVVENIILKLRLDQIVLLPVGKWRHVFDAVAFSLAENEEWQKFDASATVELNTRDPLLCEPADYQTLSALMHALVQDSESPDQGLMVVPIAAPVLVEFVPEGAARISFGRSVLADEVAEILEQ